MDLRLQGSEKAFGSEEGREIQRKERKNNSHGNALDDGAGE